MMPASEAHANPELFICLEIIKLISSSCSQVLFSYVLTSTAYVVWPLLVLLEVPHGSLTY